MTIFIFLLNLEVSDNAEGLAPAPRAHVEVIKKEEEREEAGKELDREGGEITGRNNCWGNRKDVWSMLEN